MRFRFSVRQTLLDPFFFLGIRKGGGKTYRAIFGGGGKSYHKAPPPKPVFGGLRKWDLSGLCPFPLRRMTLREQRGGGKSYHKWGGPKPFFWGGDLWYVFPSPEFPPPPLFSSDCCRMREISKQESTPTVGYPLGAGSARPNPKMGAPDPETL